MKTNTTIFALFVLMVAIGFSSCKKEEKDTIFNCKWVNEKYDELEFLDDSFLYFFSNNYPYIGLYVFYEYRIEGDSIQLLKLSPDSVSEKHKIKISKKQIQIVGFPNDQYDIYKRTK